MRAILASVVCASELRLLTEMAGNATQAWWVASQGLEAFALESPRVVSTSG